MLPTSMGSLFRFSRCVEIHRWRVSYVDAHLAHSFKEFGGVPHVISFLNLETSLFALKSGSSWFNHASNVYGSGSWALMVDWFCQKPCRLSVNCSCAMNIAGNGRSSNLKLREEIKNNGKFSSKMSRFTKRLAPLKSCIQYKRLLIKYNILLFTMLYGSYALISNEVYPFFLFSRLYFSYFFVFCSIHMCTPSVCLTYFFCVNIWNRRIAVIGSVIFKYLHTTSIWFFLHWSNHICLANSIGILELCTIHKNHF